MFVFSFPSPSHPDIQLRSEPHAGQLHAIKVHRAHSRAYGTGWAYQNELARNEWKIFVPRSSNARRSWHTAYFHTSLVTQLNVPEGARNSTNIKNIWLENYDLEFEQNCGSKSVRRKTAVLVLLRNEPQSFDSSLGEIWSDLSLPHKLYASVHILYRI